MTKCIVIPRNINSHDPMWTTNSEMHDPLANMYPDTVICTINLVIDICDPGPIFLKRADLLSQDFTNFQSREIQVLTFPIALQFDWYLGSSHSLVSLNIPHYREIWKFSCNLLNSCSDSMILAKPTFNLWNVCMGNCFYIWLWNVIIHPCHNISCLGSAMNDQWYRR